jgi:hypothetical protein
MARYDSEGYRHTIQGVRGNSKQILGYSRLAQGGADQARARANQRLYESQDHLYEDGRSIRAARQRAQRVAKAKHEGTFEKTKDTYNKEAADMGSDVAMDNAGTITRKKRADYTATTAYTPKKPARSTPMSFKRPVDQGSTADTVAMTTPEGLLDMARKARTYRRTKL